MGEGYRSEIRIVREVGGRLTARLPGGEVRRFLPHPVPGEEGASICSTLDHVVAAAGW